MVDRIRAAVTLFAPVIVTFLIVYGLASRPARPRPSDWFAHCVMRDARFGIGTGSHKR